MRDQIREPKNATPNAADNKRDLTIAELQAVSGGNVPTEPIPTTMPQPKPIPPA